MADASPMMNDQFGRRISYVRLSLTDRCDMRCRYCMAEKMEFLPRAEILSHEEIGALARAFVARGVKRIRLTGGEPLARRGAVDVARDIGQLLGHGLEELSLTTNASRLREHASGLREAGIARINVSLDTRDPDKFRHITRTGDLTRVLDGIDAARDAGFVIKINMVALKGFNDLEILPMLEWCAAQGFDLSLIETMPLGTIDEDRTDPRAGRIGDAFYAAPQHAPHRGTGALLASAGTWRAHRLHLATHGQFLRGLQPHQGIGFGPALHVPWP